MKNRYISVVCSFVVLGLGASFAASGQAVTRADKVTSELVKREGAELDRGIHAVRLSDGKELIARQPDTLLAPASVTKIITSAAMLAKFKPNKTFKTRFFHTGTFQNGRIDGDLVIVGDGDPFVVAEKLWGTASDLRHMGLKEVTGHLVIDNSLFDTVAMDQSRQQGAKRSSNAYDAPVSAFGVNFNTFALVVAPTSGRKAYFSVDPYPIGGVEMVNSVKPTNKSTRLQVKRFTSNGRDKLVASGMISETDRLKKFYRSFTDSNRIPGEYVRAFLKSEGITIKRGVRQGRLAPGSSLLYELPSYEVRRMVKGLNTYSNNYIADVMIKRLGAAFPPRGKADQPGSGTYANGLAAIKRFLVTEAKVQGEFELLNGSGLSTENRVTARQMTTLLQHMYEQMDVWPEFLASLPAAGWDGTMRKRFKSGVTKGLEGQVRAKTGTLTDPISVAGLAGYFRHPVHGMVAFCVLDNGKPKKKQPSIGALRDNQDTLIWTIAQK